MALRRSRAGTATVAAGAAAVLAATVAVVLLTGCNREERERRARETAFVRAVSAGDVVDATAMLNADPGLVTAVDESGGKFVRPLHEAIRKKSLPLVRLLLEKGVNPNAPEANGRMPVFEWIDSDPREEILDLLVARHADLEAGTGDGDRPLHLAARRAGAADTVELLLQKGAKRESRNNQKRTPLLEAAAAGRYRSAVPLCAWGADPNTRDADGKDALALVAASSVAQRQKDEASRFFGPGGGCARLVAHHETDGPAPLPMREAVEEENRCTFGDLFACGELGMRHDQGNGVKTDLEKAVALFTKACDGGAAWSCGKLAYRLETGRGVGRDLPRAVKLYEGACAAGEAWCCANLGVLAEEGRDRPRDFPRAARWYELACKGGHLGACAWLGRLHEKGLGVPRDLAKARELYRKACDGREPDGCKGLAALDR